MAKKSNSKSRLKKIQVALYLDAPVAGELLALSERTRITQQTFLREGVEHVLKKYRSKS